MKKFITFIFVFVFAGLPAAALAITNAEAQNFMLQIASIMNKRNINEISTFLKFNAIPDARFIKNSSLVNINDPTQVIATEDLNMSISEYTEYLKGILTPPNKYAYYSQINSIDIDKNNNALVSLHIDELSTKIVFNSKVNSNIELQTLVSSNCNYLLGTLNAQTVILGMNCIEKITKKSNSIR